MTNNDDVKKYVHRSPPTYAHRSPPTQQRVWQQHHVNNLIGRMHERSLVAREVFEDTDGSVKEELGSMKGADAFGSFYNALKETKDFHARYADRVGARLAAATDAAGAAKVLESEMACTAEFSGEEVFGKYLDLHAFHERQPNAE